MSSRSNGVTNVLLIWRDDLVREVVARVLELLDPADQLGAVLREALEELQAEPRDVDRVRRRAREELEELLALGCEADPHRRRLSIRAAAGNEQVTVSPPPGVAVASTVPAAAATTCLTIASPSPCRIVDRAWSAR